MFVHLVETTTDDGSSALTGLATFRRSRAGFVTLAEPPLVRARSNCGNYRHD